MININHKHIPIIINIYRKNNTIKKKIIFAGNVPKDIQKELISIEKNNKVSGAQQKILSKFFGNTWSKILGVQHLIKKGGANKKLLGIVKKTKSKSASKKKVPSPNIDEPEESESDDPEVEDDDPDHSDDQEDDEKNENDDEDHIDIEDDIDDVQEIDNEAQLKEDTMKNYNDAEDEISFNDIEALTSIIDEYKQNISESPSKNKASEEHEEDKLDGTTLKYIFDFNIYGHDNIMELKKKISVITDIPIYMQHLWYTYNTYIYNLNYNIYVNTKLLNISLIENIVNTNSEKLEYINGIPLLIKFFNVKNLIKIKSNDTFSVLDNFTSKLGVHEFNLINLDEFIGHAKINTKNNNEIEMIYYGFIVLFWPMITLSVWIDYIKEVKIENIYPSLALDKENTLNNIILETKITEEAVELLSSAAEKKTLNGIVKNMYMSITNSNIRMTSNIRKGIHTLNMRNLFDMIQTNEKIVSIKCFYVLEGHKIILNKTYMNNALIKNIIPLNSILIRVLLEENRTEHFDLILYSNGNYTIRSKWPEEELYDFEKIYNVTSKIINKIIDEINNYGHYVLINNNTIKKITKSNIIFSEIYVSFIYRIELKYYEFKIIEKIMEDYVKAGIVLFNEVNEHELQYYYQKGMYEYNTSQIENVMVLENYYSYLTNPSVKSKWENIYKYVNNMIISYRQGDIKISINGIRENEISTFYLYMLNIFGKLQTQKSKYSSINKAMSITPTKKGIKSLKEQDPVLYDFKKKYNSPIIYSKIVQKSHQPVVVSEQDYNAMNKDQKKSTVKYWNFTTNMSAYYHCPNKKYPYINFLVKKHPKDYCLPYCKIKPIEDLDKKNIKHIIYDTCIKDHKYTPEKKNIIGDTRYIMNYGKFVSPGRICNLPDETLEALLYESFSESTKGKEEICYYQNRFFLLGIEQSINGINNVGYVVCLCKSMEIDMGELVKKLLHEMKNDKNRYFDLILMGKIMKYFKNVKDLMDSINYNFVVKNPQEIIENTKYIPWNIIFIDLAFYYLKINSLIFTDKSTHSKQIIKLIIPSNIRNTEQINNPSYKNMILIKHRNVYNPIFYMNPLVYFKSKQIGATMYTSKDHVIEIITNLMIYNQNTSGTKKQITATLNMYKKFIESPQNKNYYQITRYFVNKNNDCYYIELKTKNKEYIYVPVKYSNYTIQDNTVDIYFGSYDSSKYKISIKNLNSFIKTINNWLKNLKEEYTLINIDKWLYLDNPWDNKNNQSKVIGFNFDNMNYYHTPISYEEAKNIYNAPFQRILYHPDDTNHHIYNNTKIVEDPRSKNINVDIYNYYIYELLILEFINMFSKEKNTDMRLNIKKLILNNFDTNFNEMLNLIIEYIKKYYQKLLDMDSKNHDQNTKELEDDEIIKTVSKYEYIMLDDINLLISEFNKINEDIQNKNKKYTLEIFDNLKFNFDNDKINYIKSLPKKKIMSELEHLSKKIVNIVSEKELISHLKDETFPNMLITCQDTYNKNIYCKQKKLAITKPKLDELLHILTQDIMNPLKNKWLFNEIFTDNVLNYFKFIKHPNEFITVRVQ